MKRTLCIWFPLWPVQRLRSAAPELSRVPLVLYAPMRGKLLVQACSPQAARQGVKPALPLAEAKALLGLASAARFECHDAGADALALRRLARECQCFAPRVSVDEPDSLLLDITGC